MDKIILSKSKTYYGISQLLEKRQTDWAGFSPMVSAKDELDTLLSSLGTLTQFLQDHSNGATVTKRMAKKGMKNNILLLHSAMVAFADAKKDSAFLNQLKKQWTRYYSSKSELDLYNSCQYIYTLAETNKDNLLDYKVSATLLDDTKKLIELFHSYISMPRTVIKSMKLTKQYLKANLKEIESLLKNRIDKLINLIAVDNKAFADEYYAIRPVVKTRGKNKNKTKKTPDTDANLPESL